MGISDLCEEEGEEELMNNFNLYEVFNCNLAKQEIKNYLEKHPEAAEKHKWILRELGLEMPVYRQLRFSLD